MVSQEKEANDVLRLLSLCWFLSNGAQVETDKLSHDFRSRNIPESSPRITLINGAYKDMETVETMISAQLRVYAIRGILETERGLLENLDPTINCRRDNAETGCKQLLVGFFLRRLSILWWSNSQLSFEPYYGKPFSTFQARTC